MIEVKDNGKGIKKSKLSKIFNEKESDESAENWDGTGLGLPICKYIIQKLNGFIRYKSKENTYTIFRIYFE